MFTKAVNDMTFLRLYVMQVFFLKVTQFVDVYCTLGQQMVVEAIVTGSIRKHKCQYISASNIKFILPASKDFVTMAKEGDTSFHQIGTTKKY
jgi:hypothetical protein